MAAAFVILLREGVEASMIVAILLAYLSRIGRREMFRPVLVGVAVALGLAATAGVTIYLTVRRYEDTRGQVIFETVTFLVATVALTYMTFWMRQHARSLSGELRGRVDSAIDRRGRGALALLAGQAVGREAIETVVFTLAITFSTSRQQVLLGGAAGLAVALAIAVVIYRLGHRLNLARFFTVVGVALTVFAAALLVDAVQNLQELGWLPVLTHPVWNSSAILSEDNQLGDLLHSIVGYAQSPSVLQVIVYLSYLLLVLAALFNLHQRLRPAPARRAAH